MVWSRCSRSPTSTAVCAACASRYSSHAAVQSAFAFPPGSGARSSIAAIAFSTLFPPAATPSSASAARAASSSRSASPAGTGGRVSSRRGRRWPRLRRCEYAVRTMSRSRSGV